MFQGHYGSYMVSTNRDLEKVLNIVLKNFIEEHPLFSLKYFGYEGYIHQAELYYKLAIRQPIRALIADEIGLGKTIETLMLISWGLRKGKFPNKRVLILVPRNLIGQWRIEAMRMNLYPITDIKQFEELTSQQSADNIIFIFKIDTAKEAKYKEKLLKYEWDVIVVDEVHKLGLDTKRLKLIKELVTRNQQASIIFLSATPHRGNDEQYLELLSLLDSMDKSIARKLGDELYDKVIGALVFRRSKREVNEVYEKDSIFVNAELITQNVEPTFIEKSYIEKLDELTRKLISRCPDEGLRRAIGLLGIVIDKRGLSSPRAGLLTFNRIFESATQIDVLTRMRRSEEIEELEEYINEDYVGEKDPDLVVENAIREHIIKKEIRNIIAEFKDDLKVLANLAGEVQKNDSKLNCLREILQKHLEKGEKVIVFTEFADTANYIYDKLSKTLNYEIRKITGEDLRSGSETKIIEEVKSWLSKSGSRVLISTDVASEGLNLQYANVVVNFELPWSLVKLEQRTGRIWRLGQHNDVKIYLMVLNHGFEKIIFEALYKKLAESVKARIVPSTLVALRSSEGLELPISGVLEDLSSYELWFSYKTYGDKGVADFVKGYLEKLKKLSEKLKKIKLYDETLPSHIVTSFIETYLREIGGFANRKDFQDFLCKVACKLSGFSYNECNEYLLDKMLKEVTKSSTSSESLYTYCSNINEPIIVLKACAKVPAESNEVCWLYVYHGGEKVQIKDFIKIAERLDKCEEIGIGLADGALKYYNDLIEKVKVNASSYLKREVLRKILKDYFEYLEYAKDKDLRKDTFVSKPISVDEIKVDVYPVIIMIPESIVSKIEEKAKSDVIKEIEELISIGDITEEKLEVEALGKKILEKALAEKYELLYIGDTKAPFDYVAKDRITGETVFMELKTLKKQKIVIYTENEKEFAGRISNGYKYWLYIVDLTNREIRGYLNPLITGKLKPLIKDQAIIVNSKKYYVYKELSKTDVFFSF